MNTNNNIINPKCSKCKCYFIPSIKSSGLPYKICEKCRVKNIEARKCQHNKRREQCRDCNGSSFCIHGKQKSRCRDCNGSSFCIHDKQKTSCRDCNGSSFCIHGKQKSRCRDCNGSSICTHNKIKSSCRDCNGSSFCIHDKIKSVCKECGGSSICQHDKRKSVCKECGGVSICEHGRAKKACKECNPKLYLVRLHTKQIKKYLTSPKYEKIKTHYNDNLGCTVEEFINHIEKKIEYFNSYLSTNEQMTLENISIDHIKPVSKFNLDDEDEFLQCVHYSNIQPLLFVQNMEKHNKWTEDNNKYWLENIKGKEYHEIYIP